MKILFKVFCKCDAYIEETLDVDFENVPPAEVKYIQLSNCYIKCYECDKLYEVDLFSIDNRVNASIEDLDMDDYSYEVIEPNNKSI